MPPDTWSALSWNNAINLNNALSMGKSVTSLCTELAQIFESKIQDFFLTFFQKNDFFFQTPGYQIGDQ